MSILCPSLPVNWIVPNLKVHFELEYASAYALEMVKVGLELRWLSYFQRIELTPSTRFPSIVILREWCKVRWRSGGTLAPIENSWGWVRQKYHT